MFNVTKRPLRATLLLLGLIMFLMAVWIIFSETVLGA
jgi:hypothetical protein